MIEIIYTIVWIVLLTIVLRKLSFYRLPGINPRWVVLIFYLKILAGIVMFYIYTHYYPDRKTADIFRYFDDSKYMYNALWRRPLDFFCMLTGIRNDAPHFDFYYQQMNNWYRVYESNIYNDSHTIIRFNALLRVFSFGFYQVHSVIMCFVSLTGLVALYRFFYKLFLDKTRLLFVAVFLLPSVVFWGSGVLKEGLLIFALGVFLFIIQKILERKFSVLKLIFLAGGLLLLFVTKFYILFVLFPMVIGYVWCKLSDDKLCLLKFSLVIMLVTCVVLFAQVLIPEVNIPQIIAQKQHDFIGLAKSVNSGSLISDHVLQPNWVDLLKHAPNAFFQTLTQPRIFEKLSPLTLAAALENVLIYLAIIIAIFFRKKVKKIPSEILLSIGFFAGIYILIGLTTPVVGAMVRYKVPALIFLMITIVYFIDVQKMKIVKLKIRKFIARKK